MANILDEIIAYKREEITAAKDREPLSVVEEKARAARPPRGFVEALQERHARGGVALIAEIKKASPSKGVIRADFDPVQLARDYAAGGAACLSVLTDTPSFQGRPEYLAQAREACPLPVLRKDFMLDPYQVPEARAWGADCILIIMACVDDGLAHELAEAAADWGMAVLAEVHNRSELKRALRLDAKLIGINNRNLKTFETSLAVTEALAGEIPSDRIVVSESGITTHGDIERLAASGVHTFLVGEALMRNENVEAATQALLGGPAMAVGEAVP